MIIDDQKTKLSLPVGYTPIGADEVAMESTRDESRVEDRNEDILPFRYLGGRRFEILAYLLTLNEQPQDQTILARGTGDKGRDILAYRDGTLLRVVQCKNLGVPLTKPDLLREIVKLGLHHSLEAFIPESGLDYEVWAPGDLTDPAAELLTSWPKPWTVDDVRTAFGFLVRNYALLSDCTWDESAHFLVEDLPKLLRPRFRGGIELSNAVRHVVSVYERFFTGKVVMERGDVRDAIRGELKAGGLRQVTEADIVRILDALQGFSADARFNLGSYILLSGPLPADLRQRGRKSAIPMGCNIGPAKRVRTSVCLPETRLRTRPEMRMGQRAENPCGKRSCGVSTRGPAKAEKVRFQR